MILHLSVILLLIILSAFFSSSETAFTSLSFLQIRSLETDNRRSSRLASRLAKSPDTLLTTILIGNNIVNLTASALTTTFALKIGGSYAVSYGTGILTLLILIFGEIVPKQLAITHNMAFARFSSGIIKMMSVLLYPLIAVIRFVSNTITRLFNRESEGSMSLDALMHVVDVAENEGIVDEYETSLVQRVLHFSEAPVKSVMTHRTDLFSLSQTLTLGEAFSSIVNSKFSRIPLYGESPEDIVGVVLIRDLLLAEVEGKTESCLDEYMIKPVFVPENRKVDDMLFQFQQNKQQIAIVLDEYGGLSGIVTLEDIIEQLFGEIYDEHEVGHILRIQKEEHENSYLIMADTSLQEISDELDLHLDNMQELNKTLAAYLIETLGTIPVAGEILGVDYGKYEILEMNKNRIERVRLVLTNGDEDQ
ncbi:MAG: HlyC/CorC family transporter [Sphaerochaetaceae bacterium]|nr:HlyC/CorC family transporter [Sphaerochaetaceae bacterium]